MLKVNIVKFINCLILVMLTVVFTFPVQAFCVEIYSLMAARNAPSLGIYNIDFYKTYINKDENLTKGYNCLTEFKFEEAIRELENCIKNNPDNPVLKAEAYSFIGYCHLNLRNPKETRANLERSIELNPMAELPYFFLANEYFLQGDMEKVKKCLIEAINIHPKFIAALRMLAETYKDEGNGKLAITYYKKLVDILPNSGYYRFQLYRTYSAQGRYKEAEEQLLALIEIEPNYSLNYSRLGEVYLKQKKYDKALETYNKLLGHEKMSYLGYLGKAQVYLDMGKFKEARKELKRAEIERQNNKDVRDVLYEINNVEQELKRRNLYSILIIGMGILLLSSLFYYLYTANRRSFLLSVISKFNERIENIYHIKELGIFLLEFFSKIFNIESGLLLLYNRQNNTLSVLSSKGIDDKNYENFQIITGNEVTNWIMQESKPLMNLKEIERSKLFEEAFPSLYKRLKEKDFEHVIVMKDRNSCIGFIVLGGSKDNKIKKTKAHDLINPLTSIASQSMQTLYLFESSIIDELTGLFNKRYFFQSLDLEMKRADRYNQPCSLCTFDIDDFKNLNDTYGHTQGDQILKELGNIVRNSIRDGIDVAIRTGGEEFHIILPATNGELAATVSERIRVSVEEHSFQGFDKPIKITISIGISTYPNNATDLNDLIVTSDKALYLAKRSGKNRIKKADELDLETKRQKKSFKSDVTLENRFDHLNIKDDISGLFNFSYFSLRIKDEIKRANRYKSHCSLLILKFSVNLAEKSMEQCIKQISVILKSYLREGIDTPARINDDSIAVIIPETPKEKTIIMADRLQMLIDSKDFMSGNEKLTVLFGISSYPECSNSANDLVESANKELKKIKSFQEKKIFVASSI